MSEVILVRYAEIALKGDNRPIFEAQLQDNIQEILRFPPEKVQKFHTQYAVCPDEGEMAAALRSMARVFGVAWYAPARTCASLMTDILATGESIAREVFDPQKSFAVRAQRSDKSLPFTSVDVERALGNAVIQAIGAPVNLGEPQQVLYVSISTEGSYLYTEKFPGPGGLPVGTSGKALSLISGGIDSILASYLVAKRGAQVDFLHFHIFPDQSRVLESKIPDLINRLAAYTLSDKLYLCSYLPFERAALDLEKDDRGYELVLFRRAMVRVAAKLARRLGYHALVLGDSLGQVASQTMENIVAVDDAVSIPIFRPLIGMDKREVIDQVKALGMLRQATARYKDCCAIIAPHPVTKAYLPVVRKIEKKLSSFEMVKEMAAQLETMELSRLQSEII